ncbi:hypothetical protein BDZ94DRAFT_1234435 [Collybia nuda]|uniref:FAD-binding PCMH-type domain-containing protein n=1 Tax=Collybia nuda TaxID=64659 RepID=A0A9P5YDS8_9AGAR|nr:hypothetical protein BDZ94DRAFT_1234435 [Collybia nuda]
MTSSQGELMSPQLSNAIQELQSICDAPKSRSDYFEYGSLGYKDSIRHFLASSSEVAQLAVQPGSTKDLGAMMKVLKKRQVPFASNLNCLKVKGGGHGMAPKFSSTTGIQISMARFSKVQYNPKTQFVDIGAGCLWDQVYSKLAASGRNVIGGASSDGVGVGGWLLGGDYSLKSNRYGLGIDHIVEYEIVTPDGRVREVNAKKESKLFQALRVGKFISGGGNNFGIVTKFVLKTYAQNLTYYNISILCVFDAEKPKRKRDVPFQEFKALSKGGEVWKADPAGWQLGMTELSTSDRSLKLVQMKSSSRSKAPPAYKPKNKNASSTEGSGDRRSVISMDTDDDDTDSVDDVFEEMSHGRLHGCSRPLPRYSFNDNRSEISDTDEEDYDESDDTDSTLYDSEPDRKGEKGLSKKSQQDRKSDAATYNIPRRIMVTKKPDSMGELPERGRFGCLMISKYTKPLLDKMAEEAEKAAQHLKSKRGLSVIVDAWPVHGSIFDDSPPGAAFPHKRGEPFGPMLAYFRWEDEKDDEFWITKLKGTLNRIRVVARNLGLTPRKPALYNNLSLETVPVHKIYRENMKWLSEVKAQYDPTDVMGRAGAHRIPLPGQTSKDIDSDE